MTVQLLRAAFAVAITLYASGIAFATDTTTYQGRLELNGQPYDGEIDVRFQVFSSATGSIGSQPASEVNSVIVSGGLFTAEFTYQEDGVLGEDAWLEVSVRAAGSSDPFETLSPRQKVTAAPRAQQATGAEIRPDGSTVLRSEAALISPLVVCCSNETTIAAPGFTQSFVAPTPGELVAIEIDASFVLGDTIELTVYEGPTNAGTLLGQGTSTSSDGAALTPGIQLEAGSTYTMEFAVIDSGSGLAGGADFRVEQGDAYPAGESSFGADRDAVFALTVLRSSGASTLITTNGRLQTSTLTVEGNAGLPDLAVELPTDSISSRETSEEAGLAETGVSAGLAIGNSTVFAAIESATITAPASGSIIALASFVGNVFHTTGSQSIYEFGLSANNAQLDSLTQDFSIYFDPELPTGDYRRPVTIHGVFPTDGGPETIYLLARKGFTGNNALGFNDLNLTLLYIPTTYTVSNPIPLAPELPDDEERP
ncbi:MAG: hypothetical protein AAGB51_13180 [Planctomycetota bacterium]